MNLRVGDGTVRNRGCGYVTIVLVVANLVAATAAVARGECNPVALCPGSGACTINGTHLLSDGCVLDFSGRAVTVKGTLQAEDAGDSFDLMAASLTLQGGALKARGDADFGGGTITVAVTGAMLMQGSAARIDVSATSGSANDGGSIEVTAGSIDIAAGAIDAGGATGFDCGSGGDISLAATGSVHIAAPIAATGDEDCTAGNINISGSSVTIDNDVDAGGGDASVSGSSIQVTATGGNLTVASAGRVQTDGTRTDDPDLGPSGGSGGSIVLTASNGLIDVSGVVSATGASPDGSGGSVTLNSNAAHVRGGTIDVQGKGPDSGGGTINVSAPDILVTSPAVLGADGGYNDAGEISIDGLTGDISGTLRAKGLNDGNGGTITLAFCSLTIAGTLDVSSSGDGVAGSTDLRARTMHIKASADLLASACTDDACHFLTVTSGSPTIDPGATIDPPPDINVDPSQSLCCGNGVQDSNEQCDDGNSLYCDGCRPNCTTEPTPACPEDGDLCTNNVCDPSVGCLAQPVVCPPDGIDCTADCNPALGCAPTPDDALCDDHAPCTLNICDPPNGDPTTGCRFPAAPDGTACDDSNVCTSHETCIGGICGDGDAVCCDDANPCTEDTCDASNGCANVEQAALCPPCAGQPAGTPCTDGNASTIGDACDGSGNCVPGAVPSCDDGDACTLDFAGSGCVHYDIFCGQGCDSQSDGLPCGSDFNACTTGVCQGGACVVTPRDCDDGDPTNGEEICVAPLGGCRNTFPAAQCSAGCGNGLLDPGEECDDGNNRSGDCCSASCELEAAQSPCMNDGNACTDDVCDGAGACLHLDNTAPCDDGDPCTLSSTCNAGACISNPACDDGDPCTSNDTCQGGQCGGSAEPAQSCREPVAAGSLLLIRDRAGQTRDQVLWRWLHGAATSIDEFTEQGYALCVYDASAATQPVAKIRTDGVGCSGSTCWKGGTSSELYLDAAGSDDGLRRLSLKSGVMGKARIKLLAKGMALTVPSLPLTLPVIVQLHGDNNVCWQATYDNASRNEGTFFKARVD